MRKDKMLEYLKTAMDDKVFKTVSNSDEETIKKYFFIVLFSDKREMETLSPMQRVRRDIGLPYSNGYMKRNRDTFAQLTKEEQTEMLKEITPCE